MKDLLPSTAPPFRPYLESSAAGLAGLAILLAILIWMDNVHINTTNGMYKAWQLEPWLVSPKTAMLDRSNYLYFPLLKVLCHLLDELGIYRGIVWKQLAVVNVIFAAASIGIVYCLTAILFQSRAVAALAAIFHLGSGFFLGLAISNEDILPGYTVVLASMALASVWFPVATVQRVLIVGCLFTFGWLLEWRLIFPTLPALVLALFSMRLPLSRRLGFVGSLLLAIILTTEVIALCWDGHENSGQIHQLIWTGKAMDSGWGGIAIEKWPLLLAGTGEYFLGGRNIGNPEELSASKLELLFSIAIELALLAAFVFWSLRFASTLQAKAALIIFGGTFAFGEIFNLYSQPQDPQMQINVMLWLTMGWASFLAIVNFSSTSARRQFMWLGLATLSATPLAYNALAMQPVRGQDGQMLAALQEIERQVDTDRTVFLYFGFETITTWQFQIWSRRWEGVCDIPDSPSATPKFKWITLNTTLVHKAGLSTAAHAEHIQRELDCAFTKGYRVFAGEMWSHSSKELAGLMVSLRASQHGAAIHSMIHSRLSGMEAFAITSVGRYFELSRIDDKR